MAANGTTRNLRTVPTNGTYQAQGRQQRQQARRQKTTKTKTSSRTNNRTVNINVYKQNGGGQQQFTNGQSRGLGDMDLSTSGVRDYCERGRRLFREAGESLGYAEQILRKALKETTPPPGESKGAVAARANKVGRSLKRAKYASYAASAQCVRTWTIYAREFEPWMNQLGYRPPRQQRGMNFGA